MDIDPQTLENLTVASRLASRRALELLDRFGLRMTTGGEIECYGLTLSGGAGPGYYGSRFTAMFRHHGIAPFHRYGLLGLKSAQGMEHADFDRYLDNIIETPGYLRDEWWKYSVLSRCARDDVPVHQFIRELGHAAPRFGDPAPTGAMLQQFELSTGVSDPLSTVGHIVKGREILRKEAPIGTTVFLDSVPSRQLAEKAGFAIAASLPSGSHIHYGLRAGGERNAMLSTEGKGNRLASAIEGRMLELLGNGGTHLLNPFDNDYERMQGGWEKTPRFLASREGKLGAVKIIEESASPDLYHHELRLAGGNTPPELQVAAPVIATLAGVLDAAGLSPSHAPSWSERVMRRAAAPHGMDFAALAARIDPKACDRVKRAIDATAEGPVVGAHAQTPLPRTAEEARVRPVAGLLASYAPEVFALMPKQEMIGRGA